MVVGRLTEADKMKRVPGIIFADGPAGRRARIAGTGLDVFEIIKAHQIMGNKRSRLDTAFHWLTCEQLDAALAYYAAFPEEIDARLAEEDEVTPELLRSLFPTNSG